MSEVDKKVRPQLVRRLTTLGGSPRDGQWNLLSDGQVCDVVTLKENSMNVWCVRADFGKYTDQFITHGYVGIGWLPNADLAAVKKREDLYPLYRTAYPKDANIVVGQQVGQISRFLLEIRPGDYVVTPSDDTDWLHYGTIPEDPSYFYADDTDGCPYRHRRHVKWNEEKLKRGNFSVPLQNTLRSSLTVFAISQTDEFLSAIGQGGNKYISERYDAERVVLEQILELDDKEFEIMVGHLLTALGFEGSEITGKVGDGGVDAIGELNVANLAKIKIFVQAKRYKLGRKIDANTVKHLRQSISSDAQGAFITTADFQSKAKDAALENGFPRIGLINGSQLVDLLVAHWGDLPMDLRERLGLKPGLVRVY